MHLPIPIQVLYAGLGGTLLALIVATAQQRWQPKVFFLLALRLAIGWHFLFEGLYKVHSHHLGPTETSRPFSSDPYFKVAPGPVGAMMRKLFADPAADVEVKVKAPRAIDPEAFRKLSGDEQAAACPKAVADAFDRAREDAEKAARADLEEKLKAATSDEDRARRLRELTEELVKKVQAVDLSSDAGKAALTAAKARYARWVHGVDGRPAKVKHVTGELSLTAPQRLDHLDWLRREVAEADDRLKTGLGHGFGTDQKRAAELRMDLIAAEADLAKDADAFVAELRKDVLGVATPAPKPEPSLGQRMDKVTMWFLVTVGSLLLLGLFTRLACVLAAGFLAVTYLAHPPFPWYPLPPNTEGNPLFINKNVIEGLALLALACMPTGRWLGLDALLMRCLGFKEPGERGA